MPMTTRPNPYGHPLAVPPGQTMRQAQTDDVPPGTPGTPPAAGNPLGWAQGQKTGWNGAAMPPGLANRPTAVPGLAAQPGMPPGLANRPALPPNGDLTSILPVATMPPQAQGPARGNQFLDRWMGYRRRMGQG